MEEIIKKRLKIVETDYNVKILFACETGSRVWGFASPDSDYDVRFVYMHPSDWYLSIDNGKDTIEALEGDLDLVGWDIRKTLRLFRKSNASVFERIQSPFIYLQKTDFMEEMKTLAPGYFSNRAGLHHYLSMSMRYFEDCSGKSEVKLKSYFYLLRSALASLWIVTENSIPPLRFHEMLPLITDKNIKTKIDELLVLKSEMGEKYLHPKQIEIESFAAEINSQCKREGNRFEKFQGPSEALNHLFRKTLEQW